MAESPSLFAGGTASVAVSSSITTLSAASVTGLFSFHVDVNAMAAGDVVEIYLFRTVLSGGAVHCEALLDRFTGAPQTTNGQNLSVRSYSGIGNDLVTANALQFSIAQLEGTSKSIPWKVIQY